MRSGYPVVNHWKTAPGSKNSKQYEGVYQKISDKCKSLRYCGAKQWHRKCGSAATNIPIVKDELDAVEQDPHRISNLIMTSIEKEIGPSPS